MRFLHAIRLKTRLPGDLRDARPRVRPAACGHRQATGCGMRSRPSAVGGTAASGEVTTTSGRPGRAEARADASTGNAAEDFGTRIANLVPGVASPGVLPCRAKVRRVRYFPADMIVTGDGPGHDAADP